MNMWLDRMQIPVCGKNFAAVREQTERISRCRLTFEIRKGNRVGMVNQNIVDTAIFLDPADEGPQGSLFAQHATLSDAFFEGLKKHPVPFEEAAIGALANNSLAMDVYIWLAYRLHSLSKPTPLSWRALKSQFGTGYAEMKTFKFKFMPNLRLAMAVYPKAKVEDGGERGLILHPSPPPVVKQASAIR
jgi:hypothetical protein